MCSTTQLLRRRYSPKSSPIQPSLNVSRITLPISLLARSGARFKAGRNARSASGRCWNAPRTEARPSFGQDATGQKDGANPTACLQRRGRRARKDIGFHGESLAKDTHSQAAPPEPGCLHAPRAPVAANEPCRLRPSLRTLSDALARRHRPGRPAAEGASRLSAQRRSP
jgi:hypothetical protein